MINSYIINHPNLRNNAASRPYTTCWSWKKTFQVATIWVHWKSWLLSPSWQGLSSRLSEKNFRPSAWFQVQIKLSPNSSFNHRGHSVKLLLCGTALAKFERVKGNADAILVYDSQKMQASIAIQAFWLNEITKERDPILNFSDLIINLRKQDVSRMST